jgi:hypothetical protein
VKKVSEWNSLARSMRVKSDREKSEKSTKINKFPPVNMVKVSINGNVCTCAGRSETQTQKHFTFLYIFKSTSIICVNGNQYHYG